MPLIVVAKKHVPSVIGALRQLAILEKELGSAKTYEQIRKMVKEAEALKILMNEIEEVRQRAEWVILLGKRRIAIEIGKVKKATKWDRSIYPRGQIDKGKAATGIVGSVRSRLSKLVGLTESQLWNLCDKLWKSGEDATLNAILRERSLETKSTDRRKRERRLAEKIEALPDKRYGVIYADPPWKFDTWSEKGMNRSADNHYPTMNTTEIQAVPVNDIAAPDCILFLWATNPMLPQAIDTMTAWGFNYITDIVWCKNKIGTGYWFRNKHELLLVGTRGRVPAPDTPHISVIDADVGKHSEKPKYFRQIIEDMFPTLPRIELFARDSAEGWDRWGNEAN